MYLKCKCRECTRAYVHGDGEADINRARGMRALRDATRRRRASSVLDGDLVYDSSESVLSVLARTSQAFRQSFIEREER
jgi:hypothetical protein